MGTFLIIRSGRFAKEPKIEIFANNCYDKTLTVITDQDYRPYSFYDKYGNYSGHDVELINIIANELHMNLELKFMNWNDAIEEMIKGNADILMTCDYSDSFPGVEKLIKSEPVSSDDFVIYSKNKITTSDVLYGKRIAVMKNGNVMTEINKMQLDKYCITYPNNRQAMMALVNGEVDYAIMRQTVGIVILRDLMALNIESYVSIGGSDMCFGINSNKPELVDEINNVLEILKQSGEFERLKNKWLTTFIKPYTLYEILSKNTWIDIFIIVLLSITIVVFIRTSIIKKRNEEERLRNARVVECLTQDFTCVNYVELTDNPLTDPVLNLRVSEQLIKMIPGWEKEKIFSNKLDLLRDNLVYEPDRNQFDVDTKRTKVMEVLEEKGVYFVNIRAFINNEIYYYQLKFTAVYDGKNLKGIVAGLHSVDEQTKKEITYQEKLQDALENAKVASVAKTEFLFNMSHDIRTPLNAIAGFTNMAIKHIDNKEKVLDCLQKTQQSGSLLLSLINGVLDVSRIESGKAVLELQNGDVMRSFMTIESTMKELATAKKINLSFEFANIKNKYVYCDFNRCNRVFVNIISNAIKYTNDNGTIKVCCEQIGEANNGFATYSYSFTDNGIGMSEEFQKHLFEKFSRENNPSMSEVQGTGLGMAVCKSFVDLMGGIIECKSKLGEGTTITVTLPFKLQEEEKYTDSATGLVLSAGEIVDIDKNIFKGKRVLVADDSELNLEIAIDILSDVGLIVETVENGLKAIEKIKEKGPDYFNFVLMDIRMPVMGGYEATKEIRKIFPESKLPIIALSANAFEEDKEASLSAGMDGHVAKPINIDKLFGALVKFI